MSTKQIPRYDVEEIGKKITEVIDKKFTEIEKKLPDMMGSVLDDKLQSLYMYKRRPDDPETLERIKNSFDDMDFVRQVRYVAADGELGLVIIHNHTPSVSAFCAIRSRVSGIEDSLNNMDIEQYIFHESDVLPRHLDGAKTLFERPRKSQDAAGSAPGYKSSSATPERPDDPEALEIIKNSFDDMDFVRQVYHLHDDEGFMLIIIHSNEHFGSACSAIHNRIVKIEDLLRNVLLRHWILHESDDTSRYLDGAKLLFKR